MATKRKRGATWHYTVRRKGLLPRPVYLSFQDEAEGDASIAQLERLLDRGIVPDALRRSELDRKPGTLQDLLNAYLSAYLVSASDRAILSAMDGAGIRASSLDFRWAERFVADQKAMRLAPGTIRHRTGALARCLDWAARRGNIDANPLRLLPRGYASYAAGEREDISRDRRLEAPEEAAVRRVLAGGLVPGDKQRALALAHREALLMMFDLALETAMRMSEIYTLDRRQIDIPKRTIFLERTKNGDRRQVPLSSVSLDLLRDSATGDGLLLPFFDGNRAATTSRLSRQWGRIFEHAGCPEVRFHDLRHEATCRLFERTELSDLEISLITGHQDPRMLKRYANLRGSTLALKLW